MTQLELLAPAKDADHGIAAINHGADAVYMGAPAFGARSAACNSMEDVERLVRYAHPFGCKVFATVNTLLFDHELEPACRMIHQLYNMGVDAIILQDLGLLQTELPPIELHASTQTHNYDIDRIKLMESAGFARIILARECSLERMREIRQTVHCDLEAFVQGALCVSFSGQCYMSQYLNDRSGNRGCCSQPCRSKWDLVDGHGRTLMKDQHLLSLKDFNASQHIASMVDAGVTSFKIEGRLKDLSYVKNLTGYYRRLLDTLMEGRTDLAPASCGKTTLFFTPDLERTFNRGFTDYFLTGKRQPMASFATQKSLGKHIGKVQRVEGKQLVISTQSTLTAGDGLCFFIPQGELEGFLVNQVAGNRILPNRLPTGIQAGTELWRNNDYAFEKQLKGKSAERKMEATFCVLTAGNQPCIEMRTEAGQKVSMELPQPVQLADNMERMREVWTAQLGKLGDTPYRLSEVHFEGPVPFLPAGQINELRRQLSVQVCQPLEATPKMVQPRQAPQATVELPQRLSFRSNVINEKAAAFYRQRGASDIEYGLEKTHAYEGKALMTTKYCLRYELGICLQQSKAKEPLFLRNNKHRFALEFDCSRCEMRILKA